MAARLRGGGGGGGGGVLGMQASARRAGGSNPRIYLHPADAAALAAYAPGPDAGGPRRLVVFSFFSNRHPLRTQVRAPRRRWVEWVGAVGSGPSLRPCARPADPSASHHRAPASSDCAKWGEMRVRALTNRWSQVAGKSKYVPIHIDEARKRLAPPRCAAGHFFGKYNTWSQCQACSRYGSVVRGCMTCWVWMCARCSSAHEEEQVRTLGDPR
jgi:hypothetical protein